MSEALRGTLDHDVTWRLHMIYSSDVWSEADKSFVRRYEDKAGIPRRNFNTGRR